MTLKTTPKTTARLSSRVAEFADKRAAHARLRQTRKTLRLESRLFKRKLKDRIRAERVLRDQRRSTDPVLIWVQLHRDRRLLLGSLFGLLIGGLILTGFVIHAFLPGEYGPMLAVMGGGLLVTLSVASISFIETELSRWRLARVAAFQTGLMLFMGAFVVVPVVVQDSVATSAVTLMIGCSSVPIAVASIWAVAAQFHNELTSLSKQITASQTPATLQGGESA
ncbi:hypothetical protein ACWIGW_43980 [Nocardia brasiliensis]|uniref:hypothetical protein n=1 Tax=Streptomyces sp. NPDC056056 TaxID=3345698 RepID=UPI0035D633BB